MAQEQNNSTGRDRNEHPPDRKRNRKGGETEERPTSGTNSSRPPPKGRLFAQGTVAKAMGIGSNSLWKMDEDAHIRPYARFTYKKKTIRGYDILGVATAFRMPMEDAERMLNQAADQILGQLANPGTKSERMQVIVNGTLQNVLDSEVDRWRTLNEEYQPSGPSTARSLLNRRENRPADEGGATKRAGNKPSQESINEDEPPDPEPATPGPVEARIAQEVEDATRLNMAPRYTPPPRERLYPPSMVAKAVNVDTSKLWHMQEDGRIRMYAEFQNGRATVRGYAGEDVGLAFGLTSEEARVKLERAVLETMEGRDSTTRSKNASEKGRIGGLSRAIALQEFLDRETQKWRCPTNKTEIREQENDQSQKTEAKPSN